TKTHVKWQAKVPEADGASAVVAGEYLHRVSNPDVLRCWKLGTAELVYEERLRGIATMASPIATTDGRISFACAGKRYVIKTGPNFEVLGEGDLFDGGDYQVIPNRCSGVREIGVPCTLSETEVVHVLVRGRVVRSRADWI